jgi:hypothetical protein
VPFLHNVCSRISKVGFRIPNFALLKSRHATKARDYSKKKKRRVLNNWWSANKKISNQAIFAAANDAAPPPRNPSIKPHYEALFHPM